jgi:hypothetical protein
MNLELKPTILNPPNTMLGHLLAPPTLLCNSLHESLTAHPLLSPSPSPSSSTTSVAAAAVGDTHMHAQAILKRLGTEADHRPEWNKV